MVAPGLHNRIWAFTLLHSPPPVRHAMCAFMAKLGPPNQAGRAIEFCRPLKQAGA